MPYRINHIHLKAPDPRKTAEWYVTAFGFRIAGDEVRVFGDRFVRCVSEDGLMAVNISGARTSERMLPGEARAHWGLEHFGLDTEDLEADIRRLEGLGASLLEGPGWLLPDLDARWGDPAERERLLWAARAIEREPTLLGLSPHILVVGRKPTR